MFGREDKGKRADSFYAGWLALKERESFLIPVRIRWAIFACPIGMPVSGGVSISTQGVLSMPKR